METDNRLSKRIRQRQREGIRILMFPTEVGSVPRSRILAVFPVNYRESFVCELSDLAAGATLSAWLEVAGF